MQNWARSGINVFVVNFFTHSAYAPRARLPEQDPERSRAVSLLRESEDRSALALIHPTVEVKSFGFLDAPLRLGIEAKDVCNPAVYQPHQDGAADSLITAISGCIRHSLVLSPLGLGDHVDHLAVRSAAIAACGEVAKLGFYEDLPYAIWASEDALREHVRQAEEQTGIPLRPVVIRSEHAFWNKRHIARRYRSQITPEEADRIGHFGSRHRGGERIWIPPRGKWNLAIYSTRQSASANGQSRSTQA